MLYFGLQTDVPYLNRGQGLSVLAAHYHASFPSVPPFPTPLPPTGKPLSFTICSSEKVIGDIRNKTWGFEFLKITVPVTSLTEQDFSLIQILFCALKWHRPRWVSCDQYPNIRSTASPISRVVHVMWFSFSLVSHHLSSYQSIIIHTYRLPYMRCLYA